MTDALASSPMVRFAPSPTGRLHVGNIRTALFNWLFAHRPGGAPGRFLLRLDDTDRERSREEFAEAIREDLSWLGLDWDLEARQSERVAAYEAAVERLKAAGRLYPCYETAEELEAKRRRQRARRLPPIYDRAALRLDASERRRLEAEGRKPHWRFLLANTDGDPREGAAIRPTPVVWEDLVRGRQEVDLGSVSDPVLVRADGSWLYTLPSVVDDIDFAITHVIRGEDHVTNTAVQIQLFEALGARPPVFAHHNLLVGPDGEALSKRLGALTVAALREEGLEPLAVASYAATVGSSEAVRPFSSLDAMAEMFDFAKLSRAPARFDVEELRALNARLLHATPFEAVADRLAARGITGGKAFWEAVRPNLARFDEVDDWQAVVSGPVTPVIEDAAFSARAAALLPPEPWDEGTWRAWTDRIKAETGARGRALFHPLRLALTGRERGPELRALLPLIGRDRAKARLEGRTA